jgi:hypothetical protein
LLNNPNPNIWWFVDLIKSENTHYVLSYYRLINLDIQNTKGFKERKRDPKEIQKDLDISNLKHKLMRGDIDAIEYNKRASYFMHDFSVDKTKNKKKN